MAYFVRKERKEGLPLFTGTFQQVVKWLLKAQKQKLLQHSHYEIYGGELKKDSHEFVCDFFVDDIGEELV